MDSTDGIIFLLVLALLTGGGWGCYKYGRWKERRELTMALIAQTEDTYYQGRGDAEKDCREGLIK